MVDTGNDCFCEKTNAGLIRGRNLAGIDWQVVLDEHGRSVWATAYRLLGTDADTADCFQETFVCAFEVSQNERIRDFGALLVRIATNRAINRLRQRIRMQKRLGEYVDCEQIESSVANPTHRAEQNELADSLAQAIGHIGDEEAAVFCLRYFSEMSYGQISRELGIGLSKTGVLLYRAKKKLRAILDNSSVVD